MGRLRPGERLGMTTRSPSRSAGRTARPGGAKLIAQTTATFHVPSDCAPS
jgi:hypothetical protein